MTSIITLTTDFGLKDPFVGIMKGVIFGINPEARIIDLSHKISNHNIIEASQAVSFSYRYFPEETIHVVVVDPGVGGGRRPILVLSEGQFFIGPDNGIFTPLYNYDVLQKVIHLTNKDFFLPSIESTFHGRDVYAPVAAWLSKGKDIKEFGEIINDYVTISLPKPKMMDNALVGEIISIDNFGNAITNISMKDIAEAGVSDIKESLKVICKDIDISVVGHYAEADNAGISSLINSFGYIEIFSYKNSVSENYNITTGDRVKAVLIRS